MAGNAESALLDTEHLLLEAEQQIRLIDRLVPVNAVPERGRLSAEFARGRAVLPHFEYRAPPRRELDELVRALETARASVEGAKPFGHWYAERADELASEARLALAIGTPEFPRLAAARYPAPDGGAAERVDALAAEFCASELAPFSTDTLIRADDAAHPDSLLSQMRACIGALRLPIRIELRRDLASVAAAAEHFVAINANAAVTASTARRVVQHEIYAHVLPRVRAQTERLGLLRVGARGAGEHEEGRALLLEERGGHLDATRKRELGYRHRVALWVRGGAALPEVMARLSGAGFTSDAALDLALRALRGGGLGRELAYLPAYIAVRHAFERTPELEPWFERGRVSLAAAEYLLGCDPAFP